VSSSRAALVSRAKAFREAIYNPTQIEPSEQRQPSQSATVSNPVMPSKAIQFGAESSVGSARCCDGHACAWPSFSNASQRTPGSEARGVLACNSARRDGDVHAGVDYFERGF